MNTAHMIVDKSRVLNFLGAAKGLSAWQTAKVMGRFTQGLNWRGMSKGSMAKSYSAGTDFGYTIPEAVIAALFNEPRSNGFDGHGRKAV